MLHFCMLPRIKRADVLCPARMQRMAEEVVAESEAAGGGLRLSVMDQAQCQDLVCVYVYLIVSVRVLSVCVFVRVC